MRIISTPMAFATAILMFPQFVQELWHFHVFNASAFGDMAGMFLGWMGIALGLQAIHSAISHQDDIASIYTFAILGVVAVAYAPWNTLGIIIATSYIVGIVLYESGFHIRQHIGVNVTSIVAFATLIQNRREENVTSSRGDELGKQFLEVALGVYTLIIAGAVITIGVAAHIGHLL
ncbi:MAG: hypothetical protein AAB400_03400 [Patescibacteria group bacterium]